MLDPIKRTIRSLGNWHFPGDRPDIFLFATPRGGSTWFMEMIASQPGIKHCAEPFNVRLSSIASSVGISTFAGLYANDAHLKFQPYLEAVHQNRLRFLNPTPFRRNHRFITNRMVFKIIHAGMDRIAWFQEAFGARILYVIRHPIPVALSRKVFPLLDEFEESDLRGYFSDEQCALIDRICQKGDHLEKGVVAWCLHNSVPLRTRQPGWAVVSYEQAVLEPETVIHYLCDRLELDNPGRMLRRSREASAVTNQSSRERRELLAANDRSQLVRSWREKVDGARERELLDLVSAFGLQPYILGDDLPEANLRV